MVVSLRWQADPSRARRPFFPDIIKLSTCARWAIAALLPPERPRERVALVLMSDKVTLEIATDTKPLIPELKFPQRYLKRSCESKDHDGS